MHGNIWINGMVFGAAEATAGIISGFLMQYLTD